MSILNKVMFWKRKPSGNKPSDQPQVWVIKQTYQSYRFFRKYNIDFDRNFCRYYRKLVLTMLVFTLLGLLAVCPLMAPLGYLSGVMDIERPNGRELSLILMTVIGVVECLLAIGFGCVWIGSIIKDKYQNWRIEKYGEEPTKNPSILTTWIKSKHNKLCLRIEILDKDGNPI